jgi:hypothetical protein
MARGRWTIFAVGLALVGILLVVRLAVGSDTEEQLVQRIQSEQNPVKKAKEEIKLSSFKLARVQDDYSQGRVEEGEKILGAFIAEMKSSWKTLQDSGRIAAKQPQGFRELEISLREDVRALQDLGRTVGYFDRAPLENAAQELEQMRGEVLRALFPGGPPRTSKGSPSPPTVTNTGTPAQAR